MGESALRCLPMCTLTSVFPPPSCTANDFQVFVTMRPWYQDAACYAAQDCVVVCVHVLQHLHRTFTSKGKQCNDTS
eukprot:1155181-Pelagomonas_calceolata.AAC.1